MQTTLLSMLVQGFRDIPSPFDVPVKGLALDSRKVQPGDLFIACKGHQSDGRDFIPQAVEQGASIILAETDHDKPDFYFVNAKPVFAIPDLHRKVSQIATRFYRDPGQALTIIGVTGTSGKTSTSHFIAAILHYLSKPCGVIGTLGCGLYGDIKQDTTLTTPDAVTLQKTLAEFHMLGATHVSMEVSSHSLDQGRVEHVPFTVGIFTNLTRDHLDYHSTMQAYGAAKAKLFDQSVLKYAVINVDDPFGLELIKKIGKHTQVVTYSCIKQVTDFPSVIVKELHLDSLGMRAYITTPWGEGEICTRLIGQFNLSNLLAVLATLCLLEVPFQRVLEGITMLQPVPGRMQAFGGGDQPLVVVDYSHKPDSLEKALMACRLHCHGKLFCVFGCGGDRDTGKRPIMASIAEKIADRVIVTDDNPRTEDPKVIINDIFKGFSKPDQIMVQHDRAKAIRDVIQYAKAGDCVLIAGKGAETYQQVGEQKFPFSDIEQVTFNLNLNPTHDRSKP